MPPLDREIQLNKLTRWMCAWLALVACTANAAAPGLPGPERLPADTWLLVNWHGVASANQVRSTNPVMRMWNDPQFAGMREKILTQVASLDSNSSPAESRAAMDDLSAVLENPIVLGIAGDPMAGGAAAVHAFAVINVKGREAAWNRIHGTGPRAGAEVSRFSFRGLEITRTVRTRPPAPAAEGQEPPPPKVSTSFETRFGDHVLYADHQATMESLVTRLQGGDTTGSALLAHPGFQRAQRFRAEGPLLEMFLKMPDLSKIPVPAQAAQAGMNMETALRELHLERLQGLWFSAGMARDRMIVRGAVLGDMTPGSLLDLIGGNVTSFQTLAAAPATETYSAFRLDLPALYATLLRAVKAGLPPDQGAAAGMLVDTLAMSQTGMRASELLALFSGEIAVAGTTTDPTSAMPAMLMLPVSSSEQVLQLLRRLAGPLFANEEKVAAATVVKIGPTAATALAAPGGAPAAPLLLAVSPRMLVLAGDRPQLESALARDAAGGAAPAGSLAADATFRAVRRTLPAELNGLSYTDFSRVQWEATTAAARKQLATQRQEMLDRADRMEKGEGENPPDQQGAQKLRAQAQGVETFGETLLEIMPLMQKHLKISAGGSWKAGDGMFFDSYLN